MTEAHNKIVKTKEKLRSCSTNNTIKTVAETKYFIMNKCFKPVNTKY